MQLNVEIKIKMDKGKELVLKSDEAKELFLKLQEIYGKEKEYISYPVYPCYPRPWRWDDNITLPWQGPIITYCTSGGSYSIECNITN